jgi:3'-5' exoribonuclease
MKEFYVADAVKFDNEFVTSYFALSSLQVRERKQGGQYLALTLSDKTGALEARMWEEFAEALASCAEGCYVKVQGQISKYQGKYQITLQKMRFAAESEIDPADYLPATRFDVDEMWAELRGYVTAFRNEDLKRLVFSRRSVRRSGRLRRRRCCIMRGWVGCSSMCCCWCGCAWRRLRFTPRSMPICW